MVVLVLPPFENWGTKDGHFGVVVVDIGEAVVEEMHEVISGIMGFRGAAMGGDTIEYAAAAAV